MNLLDGVARSNARPWKPGSTAGGLAISAALGFVAHRWRESRNAPAGN